MASISDAHKPTHFDKILVANRGEIAVRVIAACKRLNIKSLAVYSEADRESYHVALADEAICIGQSYLNSTDILAVAKAANAQAIHPGYGFLAENAAFAQDCLDNGIVFIGPPVAAMRAMSAKRAARSLVKSLGLPVIPGSDVQGVNASDVAQQAQRIGFPVLLKASLGGGGLGMRIVETANELAQAMRAVRSEAQRAFGNDDILLEKFIRGSRHIEVQLLGDTHGNTVHLFERECSIQRRHQKIIEESPARQLPATLRQKMFEAALTIAKAIDYCGAGTVEFLVAGESFYFLEMNTRLQVEHAVTESVTGVDIVDWQIRIAQGERLGVTQESLHQVGHAIECRICAEEPHRDFAPATGQIVHWQLPEGVRCDSGVRLGSKVSVHYDALLAKLITYGDDFFSANCQMDKALAQLGLLGVGNNLAYLRRVINSEPWLTAAIDTGSTDQYHEPWSSCTVDHRLLALAAILEYRLTDIDEAYWPGSQKITHRYTLLCHEERYSVAMRRQSSSCYVVAIQGCEYICEILTLRSHTVDDDVDAGHPTLNEIIAHINGQRITVTSFYQAGRILTSAVGLDSLTLLVSTGDYRVSELDHGVLRAPMPARILSIEVALGATVKAGDTLLVVESMKMESELTIPSSGRVKAIHCRAGDLVETGTVLITFA